MTTTNPITAELLRSFIERLERLYEDRESIGTDIKDVFAEAKASGFDTPTMRQVIRLRRMEASERDEIEHMLDLYLMALGMSSGPNELEGD